ncbi:membrane protein insertion efficiency factor YidD [Pandoraea soli]|uniref:Putative membrane protein insertion efficiency factor n=1 Tax=Pandoraea soli TaxID=2508293 RepID=A0ABY6W6T0_9BURK|nr:membrane protein insertion efficiency factor YidD [Pandoraea soli]VVE28509.1 Putative membrane protein insertion efficiency factor [Pandoraea soli]
MRSVLLLLLRGYKLVISPWLGNRCRFHPSCSDYAREAIVEHGAGYGTYLTARRLCRCHPFHPGGFDPVPPARHVCHAPDNTDQGAADAAAGSGTSRARQTVSSGPAAASAVTRRAPGHS